MTRIAVTDLTRMYDGHICVAGVDVETGERIRPVGFGRLSADLLCTRGGPLDIGRAVDFGRCISVGVAPEIEDRRFEGRNVRAIERLTEEAFFEVLHRARSGLGAIGPELRRHGSGLATDEGKGECSLVIQSTEPDHSVGIYEFDNQPKVRFRFGDGVWLSVTDVRLYEDDLLTPSTDRVDSLSRLLRSDVGGNLCLGLGRAWAPDDKLPRHHHLQVNNIHVRRWPHWRLCP